jgi:hypothetical protein
MAFVEVVKNKAGAKIKNSNLIKVVFLLRKTRSTALRVSIGEYLCTELGWKKGDKLVFLYDDANPRKWLIKKTDSKNQYTLCTDLSITITCNFYVPDNQDFTAKSVKFEISDGELRIDY